MTKFLWILRHPIQAFKIFTCFNHRDIDMETLKCRYCEKQFKYFSSKEYVEKIKGLIK